MKVAKTIKNVFVIFGLTPSPKIKQMLIALKLDKIFNDNPEVGTVGLDKRYTRLTFVCYLREKILNCPDSIDQRFLKESGHNKIK